jgi:tubulin polyglutamylase complex subunit 2
MLMHLGLPHWQYAFTKIGLGPKAKQWFNLYAPIRLQINEELIFDNIETDNITVDVNTQKIDFGKLFRGKTLDKPKGKTGKQNNSQTGGNTKKSSNQAVSGSKSFAAARPGRGSKPWT